MKTYQQILAEKKKWKMEASQFEVPGDYEEDANEFITKASAAHKAGKSHFTIGGKTYPVTVKKPVKTENAVMRAAAKRYPDLASKQQDESIEEDMYSADVVPGLDGKQHPRHRINFKDSKKQKENGKEDKEDMKESRAQKIISTAISRMRTQGNFASGQSRIPTPAERRAEMEKQKQMKKEEIESIEEATPSRKQVKQAIGIARDKRYAGGNMTGATKVMDKINKGLAQHPAVKKELRKQNEENELEEKMNLAKTDMGDVIKDFQKSDAPQFKGKSDEKKRQMAIAAKLEAEREAGMREELEFPVIEGLTEEEIQKFISLDELSYHKLAAYKNHAAQSATDARDSRWSRDRDTAKAGKIMHNRDKGISLATRKQQGRTKVGVQAHPGDWGSKHHKADGSGSSVVDYASSKEADRDYRAASLTKARADRKAKEASAKKEDFETPSFADFLKEYESKSGVYRHKGTYGTSYNSDDDDDAPKKPAAPAEKRGRGRPVGAKSGARQVGSVAKKRTGVDYSGYPLHLPNKNK